MKKSLGFILAIPLAMSCSYAQAEEKKSLPLWEVGLAGGIFSIPHYVGSDQRYVLPLAIPYVIYRGDILRADEDGIRGRLFNQQRVSLDLDFSFELPVKNSNHARRGMPDLRLVGQIGPQLNIIVQQNEHSTLSLHLPWRAAVDTKPRYIGWVTEPSVRYKVHDMGQNHQLSLQLEGGMLYASRQYNQTYYGVEQAYATTARPAYQAGEGIHSYFINASLHYDIDDTLSIATRLHMRTLTGSVNRNSPLVRQKSYTAIGLGMTWRFMVSDENYDANA